MICLQHPRSLMRNTGALQARGRVTTGTQKLALLFILYSWVIYIESYLGYCRELIIRMKALYIVGPSGSGKSTLSTLLAENYQKIFGKDTVTLVSLDPGNYLSEGKDIEINELVTVEDVMQQYQLGPNGAILYAMDFLYKNLDWLQNKLTPIIAKAKKTAAPTQLPSHIFIFDLPGQIQLYLDSDSVRNTIIKINKLITEDYGTSPCIIQLFDCTYMHNVNQFISLCMMSLSTMINLELPHINILNKVDLIKSLQQKPNRGLLNEYFRVTSAKELVQELKPLHQQDKQTNADIVAKIIDTYGQVSFMPCSIYKQQLIESLIYELERVFGTLELSLHHPCFMQAVAAVDDFAVERAITDLENEFYEEEEAEMERFHGDVKKYG